MSLRKLNLFFNEKIKFLFISESKRTSIANKNVLYALITKFISVLLSLLIVPITLSYINKEEYGIWMIIASIIIWLNLFDIGIANGLRNKLAEAVAVKNIKLARIYISSSFAVITLISFLLFIIIYFTSAYINWQLIFNTKSITNLEFKNIIVGVSLFFCLDFIMRIFSSILQALQHYYINDIMNLSSQIFGILGILLLINFTESNLLLLCILFASKTSIITIFFSIYLFNSKLKKYKPNFSEIKIKLSLPLFNLGFKFYFIQILFLIITNSSLFLVAQFFGPTDVTVFNLGLQYMTFGSMVFILMINPYLSAFTESYTVNDYDWIKLTFKKINIILIFCSLVTIALIFMSDLFFYYWTDNKISVPKALIVSFCIYAILNMVVSVYSLFLNAIAKIQIQIYVLLIQAIWFVPLSYLLFLNDFGLKSIVIVQITFGVFSSIIYYVQANKIMNNNAIGLWNA